MEKLAEVVDPQRPIVFVSDRNKGLLEAVSLVFPNSPHAFCLEHLKLNLRTKVSMYRGNNFREMLVTKFCECAYAYTVREFDEKMMIFKAKGGGYVTKFLDETPVKNWANAYFSGHRYGEMTSNVAESFNNWVLKERALPVDMMVDSIRRKIMEQMAEMLIESKSWKTILCPEMEKRLQDVMRVGRNWIVLRSNEYTFEIQSIPPCCVDLRACSCDCREWEVNGFPCGHAVAAIQFNNEDVYEYCDPCFKTDSFINSYSKCIYPITSLNTSMTADSGVVITAPLMRRPPGRPKRKRGEARIYPHKKTIRCTRCKKVGSHNRRSCKEPI